MKSKLFIKPSNICRLIINHVFIYLPHITFSKEQSTNFMMATENKWYWNYDRSTLKNPSFLDQITSISISYSFLPKNSDPIIRLPRNTLMKKLLLNSGLFEIIKFSSNFFNANTIMLTHNIKTYLKIEFSYIFEKESELEEEKDLYLLLPILLRFIFFLEHFLASLNEPPILEIQDSRKRDTLLNFIDKILEIFTKYTSFWQVNIPISSFFLTHKVYRKIQLLHLQKKT